MNLTYQWYLKDDKEYGDDIEAEADRFRENNYQYGDNSYYNELIKLMPSKPNELQSRNNVEKRREIHFFRNKLNLQFSWNDFQKLNERLPDNLKWVKGTPGESALYQNIQR